MNIVVVVLGKTQLQFSYFFYLYDENVISDSVDWKMILNVADS